MVYIPTTRPGSRAPHFEFADGRSILDDYGHGFTLVVTEDSTGADAFAQAGNALGIPVRVVHYRDKDLRSLYECAFVLVRPDGHVCWRGDLLPDRPEDVWTTVSGRRLAPSAKSTIKTKELS